MFTFQLGEKLLNKPIKLKSFTDATLRDGEWIQAPKWDNDSPVAYLTKEGGELVFGLTKEGFSQAQLLKKLYHKNLIKREHDFKGNVLIIFRDPKAKQDPEWWAMRSGIRKITLELEDPSIHTDLHIALRRVRK